MNISATMSLPSQMHNNELLQESMPSQGHFTEQLVDNLCANWKVDKPLFQNPK
jgi:hypothetical protein